MKVHRYPAAEGGQLIEVAFADRLAFALREMISDQLSSHPRDSLPGIPYGGDHCSEDYDPWPCSTQRAKDALAEYERWRL